MEKEIVDFIKDIFETIGETPTVEVKKKFGGLYLNLSNLSNKALYIGKEGSVLRSLQYVVNVYAHKIDRNLGTIILDIDGYKDKQFEHLKTMAIDAALKAKMLKGPVELKPMSAQARRIIHITLKNYPDIWTHSVGKEPRRRVIVDIKK
ncbi:MAG: hypothetical protein K6343_04755 [Caldisericaceae bacterium]